ncbi:ESX-1 secretion-associated protein [Mycolicibacterium novocastrense]|uniref:ESX-1 secretion-associated protein n=1 Tax=Mycolicibacterium novocastrense TaxID=59813 RepID=A0AAW5SHP2_MYCNV|nr:type VII secretion target [Mycolicibacterium novocastrense]MCV7023268.1 ESX-1 secretion-associated protein [Mycolicibacterium novocastrense]
MDASRVDVAALSSVARQYQGVADAVDAAVRTHLNGLAFDGACAGRSYAAGGDAVRSTVDDVVNQLRRWSRASAEIAVTLRASVDRYAEADARAADRLA